jgi:hypothetical protein
MPALQLIRDAASTAAELVALLLLTPIGPATAAEPHAASPASAAIVTRAAASDAGRNARTLRDLHLTDAAVEVRLLGLLADVRVVQMVRNDTTTTIDLGDHLPALMQTTDRLSIMRDGRSTDLLGEAAVGCDGEDDPHAGRAQTAPDEALADLLRLLPGQRAMVEAAITETLEVAGSVYRIALPATLAPPSARALLVAHAAAGTVVIIPPADAEGALQLTLRPAAGPAREIRLEHAAPGTAYVIPLSDSGVLAQLAGGAIELELPGRQVRWMTLPIQQYDDASATVARHAG